MNTRKDNKGEALKAWEALPPGLIEKPLRKIHVFRGDKESHWELRHHESLCEEANYYARRGDGEEVRKLARNHLGY